MNETRSVKSCILKDNFTTGTSNYNVLLQSKEEKKHQKHSSNHHKRLRKPTKSTHASRSNEHHKVKTPLFIPPNGWCCFKRHSYFIPSSLRNGIKLAQTISVTGNSIGLSSPPKNKCKRHFTFSLGKPKQLQTSKSCLKDGEATGRKFCILTAIKPSNVEREKIKFFKSDFTSNPQFEYASSALPSVLEKYSQASSLFLKQVKILLLYLFLMHHSFWFSFSTFTYFLFFL